MKFNDLAVRGIDISGYNGAMDWAKVKASSHFVIIRAGYGNTTDKTFLANWKNASVPKAAYWYMDYYSNWYNKESVAYGLSDTTFGILQANNCWDLLKGDPGGSIVWLDIESGGADYSPNITSSPAAGHAQAIAKAFLTEMDKLNGRENGIYCSVGLLTWFDKWFRDRPLWVAWYTKTQTVDSVLKAVKARGWGGETMMWQYASDGDVDEDGKGDGRQLGSSYDWLDLNVWVGDDAYDWLEWKHGGVMDIKPLAQGDARWKADKLGTSAVTVGGYGCLITCASMVCEYYGYDTDPGRLNVWLTNNNGYVSGNLFVFESLERLGAGITMDWDNYDTNGVTGAQIDAVLASKRPVIVQVDYDPADADVDQHWVLIVGRGADGYIINDPIDGARVAFSSRYTAPLRMAVYSGAPVTGDDKLRVKILVDYLRVRTRPIISPSTDTGKRLMKGEIHEVLERQGEWARIAAGWIFCGDNFVEFLPPTNEDEPLELTDAEKLAILWAEYLKEHTA